MRTFTEVWKRIQAALKDHDENLSIEYASTRELEGKWADELPQQYCWCVYLVEGSDEGF